MKYKIIVTFENGDKIAFTKETKKEAKEIESIHKKAGLKTEIKEIKKRKKRI